MGRHFSNNQPLRRPLTPEHHDGFAMWNSDITPWCARQARPQARHHRRTLRRHQKAGPRLRRLQRPQRGATPSNIPKKASPGKSSIHAARISTVPPSTTPNSSPVLASPLEFREDWFRRCAKLVDKYDPANGLVRQRRQRPRVRSPSSSNSPPTSTAARPRPRHEQITCSTEDGAYLRRFYPRF